MKIAMVSEYYYPVVGGISNHVHNLSINLAKLGHDLTIITSNSDNSNGVNQHRDLNVIRLGKSTPIYMNGSFGRITVAAYLGKQIRDIFNSEKFDIIHFHSPITPVLPFVGIKYTNACSIGTLHTYFDSILFYKMFNNTCQNLLNRLDGVIGVSINSINAIKKYFTLKSVINIPNGIDISNFENKTNLRKFMDGKINILFVGRFDPRNGLDCMFKAFSIVKKETDKVRLLLLGNGPFTSYYKSQVDPKIREDTYFEGEIFHGKEEYFSTCDIFCFPVSKSTFSITLLEAMASQKPVIASKIACLAGIIKHGENGLLFDYNSPMDLADNILKLIHDAELRKRLGENAKISIKQHEWANIATQVEKFYFEKLGE